MSTDEPSASRVRATERRRRLAIATAVVGVAAAVIAVALILLPAEDDGERSERVGVPTTTAVTAAASSVAAPATDWEGERFDLGVVEEVRDAGGRWFVVLDRIQLEGEGEDEWKSGPELTEEPVLCCHSDAMTRNDNPALRTYEVRSDAEVLVLANRPHTCPGEEPEYGQEPRWEQRPLPEVARTRDWATWDGVALTFDGSGAVTRIRLGGGC